MPHDLVSTQEVAVMLDVAETTIKRWADEKIIPCVRTPGGHRKFSLKDLVRFAETQGYKLRGSQPPSMSADLMEELETGVHARRYARVAGVFKEEALRADRKGILELLLYLYRQHIPLATMMDEVVRPAFKNIGAMWEAGKLEVNQEHRASQVTMESLVRLSSELHRKDSNGLTAMCACPEGELHEIGLRGLAYVLESEGWSVQYIGANSPAETLREFIREMRPDLVCFSLATAKHRSSLLENLKRMASQVRAYGGKMIIGGYYSSTLRKEDVRCDYVAHAIQEAIRYSRDVFDLKPGPKKRSRSEHRLNRQTHKQS